MQYQYRHADDGHDYQHNKNQLGAITRNWKAVKAIRPGNQCVAYLRPRSGRPGRFYAIAEVIAPRKDGVYEDTVARTLDQRTHVYLEKTVRYTDAKGAFYEDFTDEWKLPLNNPRCRRCASILVGSEKCGATLRGLMWTNGSTRFAVACRCPG
jgi:hypothetical protein